MKRMMAVYECGSDDDDDVMNPTSGSITQYPNLDAVLADYPDSRLTYSREANVYLGLSFDYRVFELTEETYLIIRDMED